MHATIPPGKTPDAYRLSRPRNERRAPWLRQLFDLYALVDLSVANAVEEAAARELTPGCRKGCDGCCHQRILLSPLEAAGLRWYVREEMPASLARIVRNQAKTRGSTCLFLVSGTCSAYAFRPVICRRYVTLGAPCAPGEDASVTRPQDLLRPSSAALNAAYALTLPYYAALGLAVPEPEGAFAFILERSATLWDIAEMLFAEGVPGPA